MKKVVLIVALVSVPFMMKAQDKVRVNEVGLSFSGLNNFGLTYRVGNEKSLWRFNVLDIGAGKHTEKEDSLEMYSNEVGMAIQIGREYRKALKHNLEFRYGMDLSFGYSYNVTDYNDLSVANEDMHRTRQQYSPGINLVLGLNYCITENIVLGAEITPYFNWTMYKYSSDPESEYDSNTYYSSTNYGMSNTSVQLSLIYRINSTR